MANWLLEITITNFISNSFFACVQHRLACLRTLWCTTLDLPSQAYRFAHALSHETFICCVSKHVPPFHCQILTDFQNSFTGTFCIKFATTWLLNIIPRHIKCVATLVKYKFSKITNQNKHISIKVWWDIRKSIANFPASVPVKELGKSFFRQCMHWFVLSVCLSYLVLSWRLFWVINWNVLADTYWSLYSVQQPSLCSTRFYSLTMRFLWS